MKIILETHQYAPELNKAFIGPTLAMVRAPGMTTIKQVRKSLFSPLKYQGRHVVLSVKNTPENKSYDQQRAGFCNDLRSLQGAITVFKARHNLPGAIHTVKTRLIG